jgi:uncharacterized protein YbaR (Trm112 family)
MSKGQELHAVLDICPACKGFLDAVFCRRSYAAGMRRISFEYCSSCDVMYRIKLEEAPCFYAAETHL